MTDMQLLWLSGVAVAILIAGSALYTQTLLLQKHVPERIAEQHQKVITLVTMGLLIACAGYAMYVWVNRPAAKVRLPVSKIEYSLPKPEPLSVVPSIQRALLRDIEHRMLSDKQLHCLALNVYHEARGETKVGTAYDRRLSGPELVAEVTLYRAHRDHTTLCAVVYQPNQFSWTAYTTRAKSSKEFQKAKLLARQRIMAYIDGKHPLKVSHFHATHVSPAWTNKMKLVADVGNHRFWYNEG